MFLDSLAIELHSTHRCLAVLKCLRSTYSWENVNLLDYVCHCFITNIIKGNSTYFNSALRDEDSGWQKENVMLLCIRKHLSLNLSRRNSVNCFFLPPQHNCRKCNSSGYCNIYCCDSFFLYSFFVIHSRVFLLAILRRLEHNSAFNNLRFSGLIPVILLSIIISKPHLVSLLSIRRSWLRVFGYLC